MLAQLLKLQENINQQAQTVASLIAQHNADKEGVTLETYSKHRALNNLAIDARDIYSELLHKRKVIDLSEHAPRIEVYRNAVLYNLKLGKVQEKKVQDLCFEFGNRKRELEKQYRLAEEDAIIDKILYQQFYDAFLLLSIY